ncbi:Uncharacterized protein C3F10.06c [Grifola frondosa]|uniref:Uncharacterized protein C3F10.06c n=1 Tax=Grifola frondosa TaxID=5627 RepID=A0A1C7LZU4_GRIFR|nr:Uncharacterized protein C3F10.06c [Grifola frondosa]
MQAPIVRVFASRRDRKAHQNNMDLDQGAVAKLIAFESPGVETFHQVSADSFHHPLSGYQSSLDSIALHEEELQLIKRDEILGDSSEGNLIPVLPPSYILPSILHARAKGDEEETNVIEDEARILRHRLRITKNAIKELAQTVKSTRISLGDIDKTIHKQQERLADISVEVFKSHLSSLSVHRTDIIDLTERFLNETDDHTTSLPKPNDLQREAERLHDRFSNLVQKGGAQRLVDASYCDELAKMCQQLETISAGSGESQSADEVFGALHVGRRSGCSDDVLDFGVGVERELERAWKLDQLALLVARKEVIAQAQECFARQLLPPLSDIHEKVSTHAFLVSEAEALIRAFIEELEEVTDDVSKTKVSLQVDEMVNKSAHSKSEELLEAKLMDLLKQLSRRQDAPFTVILDHSDMHNELAAIAERRRTAENAGDKWLSALSQKLASLSNSHAPLISALYANSPVNTSAPFAPPRDETTLEVEARYRTDQLTEAAARLNKNVDISGRDKRKLDKFVEKTGRLTSSAMTSPSNDGLLNGVHLHHESARALGHLRKESLDIFNRIHSIVEDVNFVNEVHKAYPQLPLLPNLRCGAWYVDPVMAGKDPVYFKSTDGHFGNWNFNLRRPNLHLLPLIAEHKGLLLVDSTRSGKRIPDALAKTVPIWCTVFNRTLSRTYLNDSWDTSLYCPPGAVSEQEKAQIEARIDSWVDSLLTSAYTLPNISAPLRPLWITPSTTAFPRITFEGEPEFLPIICVSASKQIHEGVERRSNGFSYVQGSGDDHEAWGMGLTPQLFWQNRDILVNADRSELASIVTSLVSKSQELSRNDTWTTFPTPVSKVDGKILFSALHDLPSPLPSSIPGVSAKVAFVLISAVDANMSEVGRECREDLLWLRMSEGKKEQIHFLQDILPRAITFIGTQLSIGNVVCICCTSGKDASIGIGLAALQIFFNDDGDLLYTQAQQEFQSKYRTNNFKRASILHHIQGVQQQNGPLAYDYSG